MKVIFAVLALSLCAMAQSFPVSLNTDTPPKIQITCSLAAPCAWNVGNTYLSITTNVTIAPNGVSGAAGTGTIYVSADSTGTINVVSQGLNPLPGCVGCTSVSGTGFPNVASQLNLFTWTSTNGTWNPQNTGYNPMSGIHLGKPLSVNFVNAPGSFAETASQYSLAVPIGAVGPAGPAGPAGSTSWSDLTSPTTGLNLSMIGNPSRFTMGSNDYWVLQSPTSGSLQNSPILFFQGWNGTGTDFWGIQNGVNATGANSLLQFTHGVNTGGPPVGSITAFGGYRYTPGPFANLPACSSTWEGTTVAVTDSTVSVYGTPIIGGGTNHVLAYCNGTNWAVH